MHLKPIDSIIINSKSVGRKEIIIKPEAKDFTEGQSEIFVGGGVDDRIEKTVGISQPQEERRQPTRNNKVRLTDKRPCQSKNEEREPAECKSAHYDAQCRRCLPKNQNIIISILID